MIETWTWTFLLGLAVGIAQGIAYGKLIYGKRR
jgi:hypothetical protein